MKIFKILILFILCGTILYCCGKKSKVNEYKITGVGDITGKTYDSATGALLSDVKIQINKSSYITKEDGIYSFYSVPVGAQKIISSKPRYKSYSNIISINEGKKVYYDIKMIYNYIPIADAGIDQNVNTGTLVQLDGSNSRDENNDILKYKWSIVSKPDPSIAALSDNTIVNPDFIADLNGIFVIELTVYDGVNNSASDTTIITADYTKPPDAPINVVATLNENASINISWDKVFGATAYNIYWATGSGVTKNNYEGKFSDITINSYAHSSVIIGNTYYYVITAENNYGISSESIEISVKIPISPPELLKALPAGNEKIDLFWQPLQSNKIKGYYIYRNNSQISSTPKNTFRDIGLEFLTTYKYKISAFDSAGNESAQSDELSATTLNNPLFFGGILNTDTTWLSNTYTIIRDNVIIPKNIVLTIEPGAVISFDGEYYIQVEGELIAQGSPTKLIRFTSNKDSPSHGDWKYIRFESSSIDADVYFQNIYYYYSDYFYISGSIISYAEISFGGGIQTVSSSPYIANNWIHFSSAIPPYGYSGAAVWEYNNNSPGIIKNNIIEDNFMSGIAIINQGARVLDNVICRNKNENAGGLLIENSDAIIEGNTINNNVSSYCGGIAINSSSPDIKYNLIINNMLVSPISNDNNTKLSSSAIVFSNNSAAKINCNSIMNNMSFAKEESSALFFDRDSIGTINNNNIYNSTKYEIYLNSDAKNNIDAANNFWNTTDTTIINKRLWDNNDNINIGQINFYPYLDNFEQYIKINSISPLHGMTKREIAE
ncbi:MAG: hypothetical protein HY934_10725, partial [Candidatus Firestonebacteria bacterium]|nr:hypothetical protein [Candidatus Firestonebacteria bacterium]